MAKKKVKVDLTVFEDFMEEAGISDLDECIFQLAHEEFDLDFDIDYPERNGRAWDNPEYQKEWNAANDKFITKREELLAKYQYELKEQEGGGEGSGEYCFGVFSFKGVVYKAEWNYYSHHGAEYDDIQSTLKIVTPLQKTVTVWE